MKPRNSSRLPITILILARSRRQFVIKPWMVGQCSKILARLTTHQAGSYLERMSWNSETPCWYAFSCFSLGPEELFFPQIHDISHSFHTKLMVPTNSFRCNVKAIYSIIQVQFLMLGLLVDLLSVCIKILSMDSARWRRQIELLSKMDYGYMAWNGLYKIQVDFHGLAIDKNLLVFYFFIGASSYMVFYFLYDFLNIDVSKIFTYHIFVKLIIFLKFWSIWILLWVIVDQASYYISQWNDLNQFFLSQLISTLYGKCANLNDIGAHY